MNRSKAPLALMGQLLMVLFFALTAAICLQAFAKSEIISQNSADRDAASLLAQNAAETIKALHGDLEAAKAALSGEIQDGCLLLQGDANGRFAPDGAYHLRIEPLPAERGLGRALVTVIDGQEWIWFSLTCSWQEYSQ